MASKLHAIFPKLILSLLPLIFTAGNYARSAITDQPLSSPAFGQMAAAGIAVLQANWYNERTGLWNTTGWWNAANAVTVLARYSQWSHSGEYLPVLKHTYAVTARGRFLNRYYDDEGWWALAWIAAYDATGNKTYLNASRRIFDDMRGGWDNTCGGGIWWSKDHTYKNAIANELFLSVAANLASRLPEASQQASALFWAQKEWQWVAQSGMINSQNLINDGLNAACRNNGQTVWTYNQGVILGGLSALATLSHDPSSLVIAQSVALAAISHLTDSSGILRDSCEPDQCDEDGIQFKGIFARNLALLYAVAPRQPYADFLQANAWSLWNNDRGPGYRFGLLWGGPFRRPSIGNAALETSAIDCLLAAAEVNSSLSPAETPYVPPGNSSQLGRSFRGRLNLQFALNLFRFLGD